MERLMIKNRHVPSNKYEIIKEIGKGGAGIVYGVRDIALNAFYVLKTIQEGATTEDIERFKREAKYMIEISQTYRKNINIVHIIGSDFIEYCYVAMVYYPQSLENCKNILNKNQKVEIVKLIAETLHKIHSIGIVHRDVKPDNILLDKNYFPYLSDFGIAKKIHDKNEPDDLQSMLLTKENHIIGTPLYMSPEQHTNDDVGTQTDIWSLGITLYYLLEENYPFYKPKDIISTPLILPENDKNLDAIYAKTLCKNSDDRYANALLFAEDLGCYLTKQPLKHTVVESATTHHAKKTSRRKQPLEKTGKTASRTTLKSTRQTKHRKKSAPQKSATKKWLTVIGATIAVLCCLYVLSVPQLQGIKISSEYEKKIEWDIPKQNLIFKAIGIFSDGEKSMLQNVRWSVIGNGVKIDKKSGQLEITTKSPTEIEIIAYFPRQNKEASRKFLLVKPSPYRIEWQLKQRTVQRGGQLPLRADVYSKYGSKIPTKLTWKASRGQILENKAFYANCSEGKVHISAAIGKLQSKVAIEVLPPLFVPLRINVGEKSSGQPIYIYTFTAEGRLKLLTTTKALGGGEVEIFVRHQMHKAMLLFTDESNLNNQIPMLTQACKLRRLIRVDVSSTGEISTQVMHGGKKTQIDAREVATKENVPLGSMLLEFQGAMNNYGDNNAGFAANLLLINKVEVGQNKLLLIVHSQKPVTLIMADGAGSYIKPNIINSEDVHRSWLQKIGKK